MIVEKKEILWYNQTKSGAEMTVAEYKAAIAEYMLQEKAVKSVEALNEIPDEEYQKMIDENRSVKEAAQGVFLVLVMKSFAKK